VTITVPDVAVSVLSFTAGGYAQDSVSSSDIPNRVYLSADLSDDIDTLERNGARGLLAIANQIFPEIPVSAGERMLVVFAGQGSAVIYYRTAE